MALSRRSTLQSQLDPPFLLTGHQIGSEAESPRRRCEVSEESQEGQARVSGSSLLMGEARSWQLDLAQAGQRTQAWWQTRVSSLFIPLPPPASPGFLSSSLAGSPASLGWSSLLVAGQRRGLCAQPNLMLPGIRDMGGRTSPSPVAPCSLVFCSAPLPPRLDW